MSTIFRKISVEDRLPNKENEYYIVRSVHMKHKNMICHDEQRFLNGHFVDAPMWTITHWFEEIALPDGKEIQNEYEARENLNRMAMTGKSPSFQEGAKYIIAKII